MDSRDLRPWLLTRQQQAEQALQGLLARQDVPARLADAMRYAVLGGGKRLRPLPQKP